MHALNLIREFEREDERLINSIKEYSNKLFNIAKEVRLLGIDFPGARFVEKRYRYCPRKIRDFVNNSGKHKGFIKNFFGSATASTSSSSNGV